MSKKLLTGISISLCALLVLFAVGEIAFRIRHYYWRSIPWLGKIAWHDDAELGWAGALVDVPSTAQRKVLFLGDSFTAGMGVPASEMYYAVAAQEAEVHAFAYGAPGYGTLQESLVLERYLDSVRPDAVVLQVCSNDLINNHWVLERASLHQRVLRPRPYLEGEEVVSRMPRRGGWTRLFLAENSRFFHFLLIREEKLMLRLAKAGWMSSIEDEIARDKNLPAYLEAQAVTSKILERMKKRLGDTPLIAFLVDDTEPGTAALKRSFAAAGIDLSVHGISAMRAATNQKLTLEDGVHLNAAGNRILGSAIAPLIRAQLR